MTNTKMHADEVETDESLVRRLLEAQFPDWSKLKIDRVSSFGTDNAIYKLGDDLAVRMPRIESAATQVDKEARWLPAMAPLLPLAVPVPIAKGAAAEGYPWAWSVDHSWLTVLAQKLSDTSGQWDRQVRALEYFYRAWFLDPSDASDALHGS
jgi:aminoglycoside phosphotransferase (APT) family kinase protein